MFGARLNYESRFFVTGQELSGIDSIDIGYANATNILQPLGFPTGLTVVAGPTEESLSLSRYLVYDDPILAFTGDSCMSGSINYQGKAYGFDSGYLNNYSVNCAVGNIPRVNASFLVYDEMRTGDGADASGAIAAPTLHIPNQGSITVTCDNSTTNRVVGFDYSITCNRKPYYTIGSEKAADVKLIPPLNYNATVQLDVDDAFMESGFSFLGTGKEQRGVSFTINGRDGTALQSLTVPQACLTSEQLNASADGALRLTLTYMGHS